MIEIAGGVWLGLCMFACTVCAVVWVGEKIQRARRSRQFGNPWKIALWA